MAKKLTRNNLFVDLRQNVYQGQHETHVWIAAVRDETGDTSVFEDIESLWNDIVRRSADRTTVFVSNLKEKGAPILFFLLTEAGYLNAFDEETKSFYPEKLLPEKSAVYTITKDGGWIFFKVRVNGHMITVKGLDDICGSNTDDFYKKITKTNITEQFNDDRRDLLFVSEEEKDNIIKSVNRLFFVWDEVRKIVDISSSITAAGAALVDYKRTMRRGMFAELFPDLNEIKIDKKLYGSNTADEYCRKAYRGGWIYANREVLDKPIRDTEISIFDVNSMYASTMSSVSENIFPIGEPMFVRTDRLPEYLKGNQRDYYWIMRFKCRFFLKPEKLPFVSIPNSIFYFSKRNLETSDIYYQDRPYMFVKNSDGKVRKVLVELTMTMTEFYLFKDFYTITDFEILDFCVFHACPASTLFENFIESWGIKREYGDIVEKEIAKIFLTRLYGKFGTSNNSNVFVLHFDEQKRPLFDRLVKSEKKGGYVPVAAAITSYARNKLIRAAQANKEIFLYANTDCIHVFGHDPKGLVYSMREFGSWKLEARYTDGIYVSDGFYALKNKDDIKIVCSQFSDHQKDLIKRAMTDRTYSDLEDKEEIEFVRKGMNFFDFGRDTYVFDRKVMTCIKGGCVPMSEFGLDAPKVNIKLEDIERYTGEFHVQKNFDDYLEYI